MSLIGQPSGDASARNPYHDVPRGSTIQVRGGGTPNLAFAASRRPGRHNPPHMTPANHLKTADVYMKPAGSGCLPQAAMSEPAGTGLGQVPT
jgi:hypothetical protein